jgi:hypothetical protein
MTLDNEERRFRAAVAAMQGLIASCAQAVPNRKQTAEQAITFAEALLDKLDEGKPDCRHIWDKFRCCQCGKVRVLGEKCEHHRTLGYVHCTDVTCQDCGLKFKQWREGDTVVRDFE